MPITVDPAVSWLDGKRAASAMIEYGRRYSRGEFLPFYVPRAYMPQVDDDDYTKFVADAVQQSKGIEFKVRNVQELRAHQRIDHYKAKEMDPEVRIKPIIVSGDGFIVDGNHRWWAHVYAKDPLIATFEIALPFDDAIEWAKSLPYVYEITPTTPERN